ncbi:sugar isomerase [bacterium]|nr:sugar isomerase [bacterium]
MKEKFKSSIEVYLGEVSEICNRIDKESIVEFCDGIKSIKENRGRLFIMGVGGSAANASHAVNDFRKILGVETYCPFDNVSELTARINDDGWDTSISNWLKVSQLGRNDGVMVYSVSGGGENTSQNLVKAMVIARMVGAKVFSITGRENGEANKLADYPVVIPNVYEERVTPHTEEWQGVIWHLVVNVLKDLSTEKDEN